MMNIEGKGRMPTSKETNDKRLFSFPDLVYKEMLAACIALIVLTVWSLGMDAPLKEIADPNWTENPAKAPWYFVGLQELLVYFDPWIAGVTIPLMIILGLSAIPYVDSGSGRSGTYDFKGRRMAVSVFLAGYVLWFALIFVGQFFRGPSWQFYWPWEDWSIHKDPEEALINLSNLTGYIAVCGYFGLGLTLPALLRRGKKGTSGVLSYLVKWTMTLLIFGVIVKIVLRIFFNVKYIISTTVLSI